MIRNANKFLFVGLNPADFRCFYKKEASLPCPGGTLSVGDSLELHRSLFSSLKNYSA